MWSNKADGNSALCFPYHQPWTVHWSAPVRQGQTQAVKSQTEDTMFHYVPILLLFLNALRATVDFFKKISP